MAELGIVSKIFYELAIADFSYIHPGNGMKISKAKHKLWEITHEPIFLFYYNNNGYFQVLFLRRAHSPFIKNIIKRKRKNRKHYSNKQHWLKQQTALS